MVGRFEETGLKDTPLLREAYDLSYGVFERRMQARYEFVPKPLLDRMFASMGIGSIAELHEQNTLRMARILSDSGVVPDEAVAGAVLYDSVKENPALMRIINSGAAKYIEKFFNWRSRFENSFAAGAIQRLVCDEVTEDFDSRVSGAFARSVSGRGVITAEDNVILKTLAIEEIEDVERRGAAEEDSDELGAAVIVARSVDGVISSLPPTPIDALFRETLERASRALEGGEKPEPGVVEQAKPLYGSLGR